MDGNKRLGLPMILFLIFMTLKLTHNIEWSWVWVSAPLWCAIGLRLVFFLVACLAHVLLVKKNEG